MKASTSISHWLTALTIRTTGNSPRSARPAAELDPQRGGTQRTGAFPYGVFKSKDGYIGIGIFTEPQWEALVRRMGREDLLEVAEFKTPGGRFENQAALKLIIEEWFATLPNDNEAVRILADELRLPAARVLSVGQFARDPVLSRADGRESADG